jgi:hypothetical protein
MLHPPWTVASRAAAGWTASFAAVFLPALPESYVSSESYGELLGTRPAQGYAAALLGCQPALTTTRLSRPAAVQTAQLPGNMERIIHWTEYLQVFAAPSPMELVLAKAPPGQSCWQQRAAEPCRQRCIVLGTPAKGDTPAQEPTDCLAFPERALHQLFVSPSPTLLPVAVVFDESAWPAEAGMRTWPAVAGGRRGIPARRPRARVSSAMYMRPRAPGRSDRAGDVTRVCKR